uniref:Uncharacterized protein n=1 Tax=Phytophthora pseudosyringae TaxID=221518 RepID=Q2QA79_9STRA|nr:unknown [Phytophthora pseudosyringae]AEP42668.1 unknown [Phytophthora pseudosyringae]AEP42671.1 unknown [Phytophthora pseudosyringae]AFQ02622.1 hypothetical protein [Phytophthora pseudosyringae]WGS83760.1 hypothetical protein [Phytophthora pseudosyringae]
MIFKLIGIIFLILLLFTDIRKILNKIKQFLNK